MGPAPNGPPRYGHLLPMYVHGRLLSYTHYIAMDILNMFFSNQKIKLSVFSLNHSHENKWFLENHSHENNRYFSRAVYTLCLCTCRLTCVRFHIKISLDPLILMHFLSAHFGRLPFCPRDIQSMVNFIGKILQTSSGALQSVFPIVPCSS